MPQLDGFAFVSRLRKNSSVPIVILSQDTNLDDASIRFFKKLNVHDFISEGQLAKLKNKVETIKTQINIQYNQIFLSTGSF